MPITLMRQHLSVDPTSRSGLRWAKARPGIKAGAEAGSRKADGYFSLMFDGQGFLNSRIIFALTTGVDPAEGLIDHINGNRGDNRAENLRLVTARQNSQNRVQGSLYGVGVARDRRKYRAKININGRRVHLGCFPDAASASAAYQKACAELAAAGARDAE